MIYCTGTYFDGVADRRVFFEVDSLADLYNDDLRVTITIDNAMGSLSVREVEICEIDNISEEKVERDV